MSVSYAAMESALVGHPVKPRDIYTGKAHAYEDTVLEAYEAEVEGRKSKV